MNNDLFRAGISRRSFLTGAGALGVLAGLGLTGCGGSNSASGSAAGNASATDGLVIPVSATVTSLNRDLESMAEGFLELKALPPSSMSR